MKLNSKINTDDVMNLLDTCYSKCLDGIPHVSPGVEKMANDYLLKYDNREKACKVMIKNQVIKCTTSGFLTGLGGVITLPVAIPANIGSVVYVQMRMIACAACIGGYDLHSDQTQTLIYACLAGVTINEFVKQAGVKFSTKLAGNMIKKIPGEVLTKINQKVGFRFITKLGKTGVVNLGKLLPAVGGVVGGGLDLVETKILASRAYKWFVTDDFSISQKETEEIIDIDAVEEQ